MGEGSIKIVQGEIVGIMWTCSEAMMLGAPTMIFTITEKDMLPQRMDVQSNHYSMDIACYKVLTY